MSYKDFGQLDIPIFKPTLEEMTDFSKYIEYIENQGAHRIGLAKIIPPKEWHPRVNSKYILSDIEEYTIPYPAQQTFKLASKDINGIYYWKLNYLKRQTVKEFRYEALENTITDLLNDNEIEEEYWNTLTDDIAIYGADVEKTLFDSKCDSFNLNNLDTILKQVYDAEDKSISGITTTYLYFGRWRTSFPWHTEDGDLYSINYLHFGEPKFWYGIPPMHGRDFETLASKHFPDLKARCPAFLRHKSVIINPEQLTANNIPYVKTVQRRNEFIVTFPYAYHAGFNYGFNCAEAVNFASPRWIEYGKRANVCECSPSVKIEMGPFLKRYQRDETKLRFKRGQDFTSNSLNQETGILVPSNR